LGAAHTAMHFRSAALLASGIHPAHARSKGGSCCHEMTFLKEQGTRDRMCISLFPLHVKGGAVL
jgi:hypothetical protein